MSDAAPQKSALIVGASRGLGLGLSLELLRRGWHVTATVRSAAGGTGLEAFHGQVTMDTLDINNPGMVEPFVARVKDRVFDVVFLNAGIGGPENKTAADVTADEMGYLIMTNAVAPVRLAGKLLPTLRPGTGVLVFMTSILGSVTLPKSGALSLYCASKAALNSLSKSFVAGLGATDITVLNMHPGWVRTELGGADAPLDVETSVKGMADVLEREAGAGGQKFLDYLGKELPW
jgi:NAD(P)-dependent dehydrogenase (short-subunit alcohol dehydrogenase family)